MPACTRSWPPNGKLSRASLATHRFARPDMKVEPSRTHVALKPTGKRNWAPEAVKRDREPSPMPEQMTERQEAKLLHPMMRESPKLVI